MRPLSIIGITLILLFAAVRVQGQTIASVTVLPAIPLPGNPVTIVTHSAFPTSAFSVLNNIYTDTTNKTIVVQLFKCRSQSPPASNFQDTSITSPLPMGLYSLSVLLFSAVTDTNGNCGAFSMADSDNQNITVANTTAVNEQELDNFSLYPNPASSTLFMSINKPVTIIITDITGRTIKELKADSNTIIDVHELSPGIYNCSVQGMHEHFSKKIVITK